MALDDYPRLTRAQLRAAADEGIFYGDALKLGVGTDDTAILNDTLSKPKAKLVVNRQAYNTGQIKLADNAMIKGYTGQGYTAFGGTDANNGPVFRMLPGSTGALFNVNASRSVVLDSILGDGLDRTIPIFSAGSSRAIVHNCRFVNGAFGVGGAVDGGSSYTRTITISASVIAACGTGVRSLIDSFILPGCQIAENGVDFSQSAGSNSVTVEGRYEWAQESRGIGGNIRLVGIEGAPVADNNFCNIQCDRGDVAGIYMDHALRPTFNGGVVRRSNRLGSADLAKNCLIYMQNTKQAVIQGMGFNVGADDGGGGATTPEYAIAFGNGNDRVTIAHCTIPPTGLVAVRNRDNVTNLTYIGIPGVADFCNDDAKPQMRDGRTYLDQSRKDIPASSSVTFPLKVRSTTTVNAATFHEITLADRRNSGNFYAAQLGFYIRRDGGNATVGGLYIIGQSTAGYYGVGTGTMQVSITNVAADGASFDLVITSTDAASAHRVEVILER